MALDVGVAVGIWVVMAVCAGVQIASWSRQSSGYVVLARRGRNAVTASLLVTIVILAVSTAMLWPSVLTVTVAVGVVLIGLVPVGWRWRRNRGHPDPRAGRSRAQRWTEAGRLVCLVAFMVTMLTLNYVEDAGNRYPSSYFAGAAVMCVVWLASIALLLVRRERCPNVGERPTSIPGWYADLCFDGRRFWNGSSWVDAPGRSRKYRMVGLTWLAWAAVLVPFSWFAWQDRVIAALVIDAVAIGILVGGGLVLALHPLPHSPREDVPPVLPPLQPAAAGWFPSPVAGDVSGVAQLRWWDGAVWTDWTYSADRI